MCVIAGYVGTRPAAPVLLEMIRRQEGLAGGYYTGLATLDGGRVHWRKVVGDLEELASSTDAAELPGNVGVAHSRSNSGGDVEWGHPFLACDEMLAYIANGSAGMWKDDPRRNETARRLHRAGHKFRSSSPRPIGNYPVLDDGTATHMSDVMAHAIGESLMETNDPEAAIAKAFLDTPSEIVGLYVSPRHPDAVFGARWNMPACVAMDDDGTYVASSPDAFPDGVRWRTWLPPSSVFRVERGRLSASPLGAPGGAIAATVDLAKAREAILEALQGGEEMGVGELNQRMDALLAGDAAPAVRYDPVYETLHRLKAEGLVRLVKKQVPGATEGARATRFFHVLAARS